MLPLRSAVLTMAIPVALLGAGAGVASADDTDLAKAPPADVLARVKTDLAKVKSFHFQGQGGGTKISADVTTSGARMTITEGKLTVRTVFLANAMYLKADAAYWRSVGGKGKKAQAVARKLANRWVKAPAKSGDSLDDALEGLTPKDLASCIDQGNGTLENKGEQTLGGEKVIVLEDKGDKPGSAPGLLYLSTGDRVLPLRIRQTGKEKKGGKKGGKCGSDGDDSGVSDVTFSRFDAVARITAPKGAKTAEQIVGGGGGSGGGEDGSTPV